VKRRVVSLASLASLSLACTNPDSVPSDASVTDAPEVAPADRGPAVVARPDEHPPNAQHGSSLPPQSRQRAAGSPGAWTHTRPDEHVPNAQQGSPLPPQSRHTVMVIGMGPMPVSRTHTRPDEHVPNAQQGSPWAPQRGMAIAPVSSTPVSNKPVSRR
jgi:hypothetical protein